jgi:SAM-dependent methyltransferase
MDIYCNLDDADVMEIGAYNVNGTLRDHVRAGTRYVGVDMEAGPGVDLVVHPQEPLPFDDEAFDFVVASSVFEHDPCFWDSFLNMARKTKVGGYIYLNVPSNGTIHRYPNDCWRFYPDAGSALAQWAQRQGLEVNLVESFIAERQGDVWNDFVAIFRRGALDEMLPERFVHESFACTNVKTWKDNDLSLSRDETEDMLLIHQANRNVLEHEKQAVRLAKKVSGQRLEIEWLRKALNTAHQEYDQLRNALEGGADASNLSGALISANNSRMSMQTDFAFDIGVAVEEAQRLAEQAIGLQVEALDYGDVSDDEAAIVGKEGFAFINGGSNAWSMQIQGKTIIADDVLEQSVADIGAFRQLCAERSIAHCVIIVPEKDIVYPELSPNCKNIELGRRSIHRLRECLPSVRYPLDQLIAAKPDALMYHRRDSHYNAFGGLIVANDVLNSIGVSPIDYSEVPFAHREFQDDLAVKWEAFPTMRRIVPFDYIEEVLQEGDPLTGLHIQLRSTHVQNGETVMIFGDSYSWNPDAGLSRFMTRRFETTHFIWARDIDWALVDTVAPSAIIMQSAERFLTGGIVYRKQSRKG